MAETDRGTTEPGSSRSGTDVEQEKPPAEPKSKNGKAKAKTSRPEGGGGSDAENGSKSSGKKEETAPGKEGNKKGDGKKNEGEQKKESAKKENKNDEGKRDEGKKEGKNDSVKTSDGMKDGKNEGKKSDPSDPKLEDLMKLWMEFQSTNRESSMKIQKLESTLKTLETSLDRFGKFCGEYQLIWRVKNFNQKFDEARSGERPIIYSPTFDTHRSGYKLQLSLCPNGDGKGQNVAMSLFFAILKGPYDSLLQWPFTCPVTITLLEQVSDLSAKEPRDVTMTFVPNPRPDNAPFLGKPDEGKNLSLGFQKFIQLTDLFDGEYIQDDSIFIKVYVDISNVMAL